MAQLTFEYSEEDLQNYLCNNIQKHYPEFKFLKKEFNIPGGRIDILCKHKELEKTYIVIELKIGDITCEDVCQVLRYTQYLNSEMSKNSKRTFYPLLIGKSLSGSSHLTKLVNFYYGCFKNCFYCNYNLFSFDIESMGFDFTYYSKQNKEYIDENFRNCRSKIDEVRRRFLKNYNFCKELIEENKNLKGGCNE